MNCLGLLALGPVVVEQRFLPGSCCLESGGSVVDVVDESRTEDFEVSKFRII